MPLKGAHCLLFSTSTDHCVKDAATEQNVCESRQRPY